MKIQILHSDSKDNFKVTIKEPSLLTTNEMLQALNLLEGVKEFTR